MNFCYTSKSAGRDPRAPFTLDRVWKREGEEEREISHLLDRSYQYQSPRELRWHLADRFGFAAPSVAVIRR